MSDTTSLAIDRDAGSKKDVDPTPAPPIRAPAPAVDPQDRIDLTDEQIVGLLTSPSARYYASHVLEHVQVWGGLRGFESAHPLSYPLLRSLAISITSADAFAWAYAHDAEILHLVRNSVALQRHALDLRARFVAGSAGALEASELADEHELDYMIVLSTYQQVGDRVLRDWHLILDDVDAESLHIDHSATEAQKDADDVADEALSWKLLGETLLGQQIATKEITSWLDDDVTLDALSTPEDGVADWDRAIAWSRLAGHSTAIVELSERYFIYRLNHDYAYDDIWEAEEFEEARTALVPGGAIEARAITTSDGYVVTPRDHQRFFGGYQSKHASQALIADLDIAENQGERVDGTRLVQQIAFDMLMLQLSDAEERLNKARAAITPGVGVLDPANGTRLQTDTADLKDHIVRAAQLSWDASDPPTAEQRDAMEDELQEIGRIASLDPIAASMVVNKRDADDTSRPDESQYEDRVAGQHWGDALEVALKEIDAKLANLDEVRKHFYASPDDVWGMSELIDAARQQLPADQQFGISYSIFTRGVGELAQIYREALKDIVLFSLMFASGEGWLGMTIWGYQSLRGAQAVQQGFANAELVGAMTNLDLAGGMQLATPEQAASARGWAWINLGLAVLDSCLFIRSATHMFRLSAVMSDPELAKVLRYTGRPVGDLASDLGMSERKLVNELAAARGSEREALLERIRGLQTAADHEGNILASGRALTGDNIKVTSSGDVVVCNSPCQWLRDRFQGVLALHPELESRLATIEADAAQAAATMDPALRGQLARKAIDDTRALWREMLSLEPTARIKPVNGTVNVGGGGGPKEPQNVTNLNPVVPNTGGPQIGIPNWVPARFEEIDLVFEQGSVNNLVGEKIPYGANVDWARGAQGAFKVMSPGGSVSIQIWGASAEQMKAIEQAFRDAGFTEVKSVLGQILEARR
jgi:hypothetical protein